MITMGKCNRAGRCPDLAQRTTPKTQKGTDLDRRHSDRDALGQRYPCHLKRIYLLRGA
jgi:hypothetical protein